MIASLNILGTGCGPPTNFIVCFNSLIDTFIVIDLCRMMFNDRVVRFFTILIGERFSSKEVRYH